MRPRGACAWWSGGWGAWSACRPGTAFRPWPLHPEHVCAICNPSTSPWLHAAASCRDEALTVRSCTHAQPLNLWFVPQDRQCMGIAMKYLDSHSMVYVLTLGVVEPFRHCGIARCLLTLVHQHACRMRYGGTALSGAACFSRLLRAHGIALGQALHGPCVHSCMHVGRQAGSMHVPRGACGRSRRWRRCRPWAWHAVQCCSMHAQDGSRTTPCFLHSFQLCRHWRWCLLTR